MKISVLNTPDNPVLVSSDLMLSIVKARHKDPAWTMALAAADDVPGLLKLGALLDAPFRDDEDWDLFHFQRDQGAVIVVTVRSPGLSVERVIKACGEQPKYAGDGLRRRLIIARAASAPVLFAQFLHALEDAEDLN